MSPLGAGVTGLGAGADPRPTGGPRPTGALGGPRMPAGGGGGGLCNAGAWTIATFEIGSLLLKLRMFAVA